MVLGHDRRLQFRLASARHRPTDPGQARVPRALLAPRQGRSPGRSGHRGRLARGLLGHRRCDGLHAHVAEGGRRRDRRLVLRIHARREAAARRPRRAGGSTADRRASLWLQGAERSNGRLVRHDSAAQNGGPGSPRALVTEISLEEAAMSQQPSMGAVLVTTTERPAGYEVKQAIGQVFGVVVRSRGLGGNILAGLRALGGGEIVEYTRLVEDTRRHAVDRMVENARSMGGNAVVMMRFDSSEMGQTMTEVVAYGTAAIVEKSST